MSQHTKGPWKFRTAANGDCGISAEGTGVFIECFAEIRHSGENALSEALANAALVVALPDLIEALQEARTQISLLQSMRGIVDTGHGTLSIIDAALAKAGVKVEMEDAGQ